MTESTTPDLLPSEAITKASEGYPKPEGITFGYGTAGFRTKGSTLESTLFRIGLLATLRSKKLEGRAVGVMITASHNPEEDNGAKLVDPRGEMLDPTWEPLATLLSNATTPKELLSALTTIIQTHKIDLLKPSFVIYAADTRPSSPVLVKALEAGLEAMRVEGSDGESTKDLGVVTTPVLHYVVRGENLKGKEREGYGEASYDGYIKKISESFGKLMHGKSPSSPLYIDCANGVGSSSLKTLAPLISQYLPIKLVCTSTTTPGALNKDCGADYVKTGQRAPPGVLTEIGSSSTSGSVVRACSIDGDADRVVYYSLKFEANGSSATSTIATEGEEQPQPPKSTFTLLDGDKIATLAAGFIGDLVKTAGLQEMIKLGVVQTAYANGNSTRYLQQAGLPVKCTSTGVKHLHHAAERYDIGVYFEANGHGTILFSPETLTLLKTHEPKTPAQSGAIETLLALTDLINQAVGDAISDLLLVEVILAHKKWGPEEWNSAYEDLPNRLVKVNVKDRSAFKTEDAERRLTDPKGLQAKVDEKVKLYEKGRSFVRPSGTEDCVRVYAEASTKGAADDLAFQVSQLVSDFSSAN